MKNCLVLGAILLCLVPAPVMGEVIYACTASKEYTSADPQYLDHFGASLAVHGDWNGDGYRDLLVGGMVPPTVPNHTTRAWIILGSPTGPIEGPPAMTFEGGTQTDLFGWDTSFLPDVDGDGRDEIIVGAPGFDAGRGRVYIFFGLEDGSYTPGSTRVASDYANLIIEGTTPGSNFGYSLAANRNINGEGLADLIVGAPGSSATDALPAPGYPGEVFLFYGPTVTGMAIELGCSSPPCTPIEFATTLNADVPISGANAKDRFGKSVAVIGNIDGIAGSEFIVGAPQLNIDCGGGQCVPPAIGPGYARVFRGATGQLLAHLTGQQYDAQAHTGEGFGWAVAGMADFGPINAGNGQPDGMPDFLIGAFRYDSLPGDDVTREAAGRVWAYSGSTLAPIPDLLDPVNGTKLYGEGSGDQFGWSLVGSDDLSADGVDDIIVGAWRATHRSGPPHSECPGGDLNGAVYIIESSDGLAVHTLVGALARDRLGWDVDAAHLNDDGSGDVDVISAGMAWSSPTPPTVGEAGKAYLYFGENL